MEKKNLLPNRFNTLLLDSLVNKKNWFLISFAILIITVLIMPLLLAGDIGEANIVVGMVEIFILVFINCILDFSYLHEDKKFTYYASKPVTNIQRINLIIITNLIFTAVIVGLLVVINLIAKVDINEMYIVTIPWLITGILTAALSSVLGGNSIAAAIGTVINFTLPLSFLAIFNYLFTIIEDVARGFNADILFNNFLDNYYRIDLLYFVKFIDKGIDYRYFIILSLVSIILYLITYKLMDRRKNERASELVVFDGYKYFISLILATLAPIVFSLAVWNQNFVGKLAVFVLLSALAYYIINAVLEKSFSPSKKALKMYLIYIIAFAIFIAGGNIVTGQFESYVPETNEVEYVFIGNSMYHYYQDWDQSRYVYDLNLEDLENEEFIENASIFMKTENIENIIKIHKYILEDQNYFLDQNIIITYVMKNGDNVTRYYKLEYTKDYDDDTLNSLAKEIIVTEEFQNRLPYNHKYFNKEFIESIRFETDDENGYKSHDITDIDIDELKNELGKDYDKFIEELKYSFELLRSFEGYRGMSWLDNIERMIEESNNEDIEGDIPITKEEAYYKNQTIIYEIKIPGEKRTMTYDIYLSDDFENTLNYINDYLSEN